MRRLLPVVLLTLLQMKPLRLVRLQVFLPVLLLSLLHMKLRHRLLLLILLLLVVLLSLPSNRLTPILCLLQNRQLPCDGRNKGCITKSARSSGALLETRQRNQ